MSITHAAPTDPRRSHVSAWGHRPRVTAGAAALALVALLVAGHARSASGVSGRIVFARADGIYAMNADGSGVHALRKGPQWFATTLAWSPDGRKLAFVTRRAIWVMNADGSHAARLTPPVRGRFGVYVGWMSPTWSPDGHRIAYTFSATAKADRDVWVMNADGSKKTRLARTSDCSELDVDWSPIGDKLVTTCVFGWGSRRLVAMDADGGNRHDLHAPRTLINAAAPDWSPDGRRIVFSGFRIDGADITILDTVSGSLRRLVANGHVNNWPDWSPDGRTIAFNDLGRNGGICSINAEGSGLTRLTDDGLFPAWQPSATT